MLSRDDFATLVRLGPLVSIDLIVHAPGSAPGSERILVGYRNNEPAKGWWFVPGGSIKKGERLATAFARLTRAELGVEMPIERASFRGVYEHLYDTNITQAGGFGTHYIVLAHDVRLDRPIEHLPNDQHGAYRWLTPAEILADPRVHGNTKAYCR